MSFKFSQKLLDALALGIVAHKGQKRKYEDIPYFNHCIDVADKLAQHGINDENVQCAALLHDTFEDTEIDPAMVCSAFGEEVFEIVMGCTNVFTPGSVKGNRRSRKSFESDRISLCSKEVQDIKIADAIINCEGIFKHDKDFARIYLQEKRELADKCKLADESLKKELYELLEKSK